MVHSNNISTATTDANNVTQGKHKGTKSSKTLFSSLLALLQKGADQGGEKKDALSQLKQANKGTPDVSTQDNKSKLLHLANTQGKTDKNLQHTLPQIEGITSGNIQATNTQVVDKNLQHILQQAKNTKGVDKNLQHTQPQVGSTQAADKNVQHILQQVRSTQSIGENLQHTVPQAGNTQVIDKNLQHILTQDTSADGSDAIASLQEAPATPLVFNKQKADLPFTEKQSQQRSRTASQVTTQNVSPELLAEASNQKNKGSKITEQQNTERFATSIQYSQQNKPNEQPLTALQNKQVEQQVSTQQINKVTNGSEQANDGIKTSQAAIAAIQQRTSSQTQQNQAGSTNAVAAANSPSAIRMAATDNSASSQQDLNSNQRDADMSLLDAAKADNKSAKGLDFQAQLAYKSQRTFTPADTMLEIVKSAKTGNTTLELQLEPANLGKVQVSIQIDQAKHIQVVFTVDQAASKQALEQQMPQLRLAMAQQGLDLSGFSMQMNQQGGQQGRQQQAANDSHTENNQNTTTLINPNDKQNTRIGVNLAAQGHLSILA